MQLLVLILALTQAPAQVPAPAGTAAEAPAGPFVALAIRQGQNQLGTVTIALRPDKAPISVANFLEYLREGHYDGTIFHRVLPGFMIQGGGFSPEMEERPQRAAIRNEARNRLRNERGAVSMARTSDPDSATDQFFVNVRTNHNLDFGIAGMGYAVFGKVVDGMDVVDLISTAPTTRRGEHENTPQMPVIIVKAYEVDAPPPPEPAPAPAEAEAPATAGTTP
jgi:peptidyl-prolyl cis-trans isomerase A (cyclophilin A)